MTSESRDLLKRMLDVTVSAVALVVLSPLCIAATILIWIESGRPIIFRQQRVGANFKHFAILKFRTMRMSAPGASVTVAKDQRITRVGSILRAAKIDELPQLWNVLRGDMSLVGPRPEVPEYVDLFKERYKEVLSVRPGITDFASIRFRNEAEVLAKSDKPLEEYVGKVLPAKLTLAEDYVRTRTFMTDVIVLVSTAFALFKRTDCE